MKSILILLICFAMFSCRSTKQIVKSDTKINSTTEQEVSNNQEVKADTKTVIDVVKTESETDTTLIVETITELSKPDSVGKQHTQKITKRVIATGKNKQVKTDVKEVVAQVLEKSNVQVEKKIEKQEVINKTDTKTVKKSQSVKVIIYILLGLGVLGFVIYKTKGEWVRRVFSKIRFFFNVF